MTVLVVGGGIAGLTLADRLVRAGRSVTVVERAERVGGLARSMAYDDGFTFDLGPHRFHTEQQDVLSYIHEVLDGDEIRIDRCSGVHLFDKQLSWPLTLRQVAKLPLPVLVQCGLDLFRPAPPAGSRSFADYIKRRYGRTLYERFFRNYSSKFLRYSPEEIHEDWASASINRAVIDRKLMKQSANLLHLVKGVLLPQVSTTEFIYPASGGIGVFCDRQAARIRQGGGEIRTGTTVRRLETEGGRIRGARLSSGEDLDVESLVWTAPLPVLLDELRKDADGFHFLSTIFYNLGIHGEPRTPFQWCYFGEKSYIFSRVTCMNHFNPAILPEGATGLTVELPCYRDDMLWQHPEKFLNLVILHLIQAGILNNFNEVDSVHIERIEATYPVYHLGYLEHLERAFDALRPFENLYLLGRCGMYWYNNMDHSMEAALALAPVVEEGRPFGFALDARDL